MYFYIRCITSINRALTFARTVKSSKININANYNPRSSEIGSSYTNLLDLYIAPFCTFLKNSIKPEGIYQQEQLVKWYMHELECITICAKHICYYIHLKEKRSRHEHLEESGLHNKQCESEHFQHNALKTQQLNTICRKTVHICKLSCHIFIFTRHEIDKCWLQRNIEQTTSIFSYLLCTKHCDNERSQKLYLHYQRSFYKSARISCYYELL